MKPGDIPVLEAVGSIPARSASTSAGRIRKGQPLTPALMQPLQADGVECLGGSGSLAVAALVLAAGSSRRFGNANKLLATRADKPLLVHVLDALRHSEVDHAVVVTGHDARSVAILCKAACHDSNMAIRTVHNALHASGMASSLVRGIAELGAAGVDAVIVCLADMPDVTPGVINALVAAFRLHPGKALYIPTYEGKRGNPVLIAASLFDLVLTLDGDVGARVLARQFPDSVLEVPCDSAGVLLDIDVPADLQVSCDDDW